MPAGHDELNDREDVHAQLEHEEYFELVAFFDWPVGVVCIHVRALALAANHAGEPRLLSEDQECRQSGGEVEPCVEDKLGHALGLEGPGIALVLRHQHVLDTLEEQVVETVLEELRKLKDTHTPKKPMAQ
jgi:hypothetical protein